MILGWILGVLMRGIAMGMVRTWDREFESMLWYYKNACRYLERVPRWNERW
jgi:hypothetical protein